MVYSVSKTVSNKLMCTTTPGLSRPGSNNNEEVFHIPQSSRTGTPPLKLENEDTAR